MPAQIDFMANLSQLVAAIFANSLPASDPSTVTLNTVASFALKKVADQRSFSRRKSALTQLFRGVLL